MAKLLTNEETVQGDNYPLLLELTIIKPVPEGKKIEQSEYETLLLEGIASLKFSSRTMCSWSSLQT